MGVESDLETQNGLLVDEYLGMCQACDFLGFAEGRRTMLTSQGLSSMYTEAVSVYLA